MTKRKILLIGVIIFISLFILSVVFYKERICFSDASFHLFHIVKDQGFAIQRFRFVAFFTQIFPLIGIKLGASLPLIAVLYSSSFVLLSFISFLVILLWLENKRVSIAYLIYLLIMSTHIFYWPLSEMSQGFALLFILIAFIDNIVQKNDNNYSNSFWFSTCLIVFIVSFSHPLAMIPFVFLTIFYLISYPNQWKLLVTIMGMFISFVLIHSLFFTDSYDSQAIGQLKNFITYFPNYFSLQSSKNLVSYFITDYYFAAALFIVVLAFYLKHRLYFKLFLLFGFFLGFCLLVNVSYPDGANQFYLENQYLLLGFFVALPFVIDVLPKLKTPNFQLVVTSVICIIGIYRVYNAHDIYTTRLNWNRNLLSSTSNLSNKKLILTANQAPVDTLFMTWGSSFEIWLLSTIETGISRSIIIEESPNEFDWKMNDSNTLITKWEVFNYADLNRKYFIFNDTSTGYIRYTSP